MSIRAPRPSLEGCPMEVLEQVALSLVDENAVGPPIYLPPLLRTSTAINSKLSLTNNPSLYSTIFAIKFDVRLATRRLGGRLDTSKKAQELVKRFITLRRFKHMDCREFSAMPTAREDTWLAYLMFLEHEEKNHGQLVHYAGVDTFASHYIQPDGPFHDGTESNGGWKVDNEVNALVIWLFWFTDKERMKSETAQDRQCLLNGLAHLFTSSFKYASTHAPVTSFMIPPAEPPPPRPALALAALPYSRPTYIKDYFGINPPITHPLLTPAVFLICVVRLEAAGAVSPIHLPLGFQGPTIEEVAEQTRPTTRFVDWREGHANNYEHEWNRLITCYSPWTQPMVRRHVFTPGMLAGTWTGRLFEIPEMQFDTLLVPRTTISPQLLDVYPKPMQFTVREYHQHDPSHIIGFNDISQDLIGEGIFKAWLPNGVLLTETPDHLYFSARSDSDIQPSTYDLYDPAFASRALDEELARTGYYGHGVYDIVLTAETNDRFGRVWGYKRYYGRVRAWDGLIVLISVAMFEDASQESLMFYGYIHGNQNLIGRWRETATPVDQPGWEGVWSMSKVD